MRFPSLTVAFQNLAANSAQFRAVFLQTCKKSAIAGPGRDRMAEPAHIWATCRLFLWCAAFRESSGSSSHQHGCEHQFTDHHIFSLILAARPIQLGIGWLVAADSPAVTVD